jgi:hypothetical protein
MTQEISFEDPVMPPGSSTVALLAKGSGEFLLRKPVRTAPSRERNEAMLASPEHQNIEREQSLIRRPSTNLSKRKAIVLQRWTGVVERVTAGGFLARISDHTNPSNPPEEVELDLQEVSKSDRPLVVAGAAFYWSIGYRDTEGGQRERVATLRFARQPSLSQTDVDQIFEEADDLAAYLESA